MDIERPIYLTAVHLVLTAGAAIRIYNVQHKAYGYQGRTLLQNTNQVVVFMSALQDSPRISPFLWFDSNAEEAVDFYLTVFKNSRKLGDFRAPDESVGPKGKALTVSFELDGQRFTALNGGPHFKFTEAVSFVVSCKDQAEVDYYWSKLTADGGSESQCGWLKDKFGLSWQIVPAHWPELIKHPKAMQAMMGMKKLNIAELERAGQS
jgi:predicted 3-demethylubiquinone-9 3-methyltransferase (glyoxalase superfamily)